MHGAWAPVTPSYIQPEWVLTVLAQIWDLKATCFKVKVGTVSDQAVSYQKDSSGGFWQLSPAGAEFPWLSAVV